MKAMVLDGIPGLPGIFCVSFYDTKPINFLLMCCKNIKCIQKTQKVYDPGKKMVRDAYFLYLDVNDSYNGSPQ